MVKEKNFKSVYIHNGCRNPKVNIVNAIQESKAKRFVISLIEGIALKVRELIDSNLSDMDAETLKGALHGPQYLKTYEHAARNLSIEINHVRIVFWMNILQIIIKLAKKLNVYD